MRGQELTQVLLATLLVGMATVGSGGYIGSITDNVSFTCRDVEGEVVWKDHSEGWFKIYVTLYNDSISGDGQSDYSVYVGPDTYDRYQIGDTYTEQMCDVEAHNEFKQFLQDLLDAGLLEQGS